MGEALIGPEDIDAFAPDLSDMDKDDMQALYRAAMKMHEGVPSLMEFPAQDVRKIVRAALKGWELWAQSMQAQHRAGLVAMGCYNRTGRETS